MALTVWKGHGTENDFVVLPDLDGALTVDDDLVQRLCDRRAGIGADGVLRVVATRTQAEVAAQAVGAPWFMDYRNADGSVAEMCGNGVRVFARYLVHAGLIDPSAHLHVATRGGPKPVRFDPDGRISVDLGPARSLEPSQRVTVPRLDGSGPLVLTGSAWLLPNPHVVCEVSGQAELDRLDLARPPSVDPGLPLGQNVEFVVRDGVRELSMRVHERGSGETRSCGTGICAVVAAYAPAGELAPWTVHVPGGTCTVTPTPAGTLILTGPAVLVARVELLADWLRR